MTNQGFYLSRLAMSLADQFLLFVVPIMVFQVTQSIAWSSFAFALETIPRVIAYPLAGILSDRYCSRLLLKISLSLRSIFCLLALLVAWALGEGAVLIIVITLSAVTGVLSVQGFMASEVLLPEVFKQQSFTKIQASVQSVDQISIIAGPLLAAFVLQFFDWLAVLLIAGSLFVIAQIFFTISTANLKLSPSSLTTKNLDIKSIAKQLAHSCHLIKSNQALLMVIGQTALINLIFGAALATGAALVAGKFHLPSTAYGFLQMMGALTAVVVLGSTAVLAKRILLKTIGVLSFCSICIGGVVYALSDSYSIFVLGFMLILGFDGMFNVYIRTTRQAIIPAADYGKATGMIVFFNNLTKPVAGLLIAALDGYLSAQWVVLSLVIFTIVVGLFLFNTQYFLSQANINEKTL